jgi:hypothetical protein
MPRRFGTMTSSRPPPASTRQTSFSIGPSCSLVSSACTSSTRSIEKSANGSSPSSARVARLAPSGGQASTPSEAGSNAIVRSASGEIAVKNGAGYPAPRSRRPLRSGHIRRIAWRIIRRATPPSGVR